MFREAELRFVYYHHRHVLLVQCFQEKFEMVKDRIQKMRSPLSTIIVPVKSPILSRFYSKSNETQRIAGMKQLNQFYILSFIILQRHRHASSLSRNVLNLIDPMVKTRF